jgi:anti-sigma regulatory factor (Ser/Thr protein kinase)
MRELALHLLDLAENSVAAGATRVAITVEEDLAHDRLRLCVTDNGRGMDASFSARASDPFVTTRRDRKVGLGLALLAEAAEACAGTLSVESTPGAGTTVAAEMQHSHVDRMPLGDLAGTWLTLLVTHGPVNWQFEYRVGDGLFVFDDADLKRACGGLRLSDPAVLQYLRPLFEEGVACVRRRTRELLPAGPAGGPQ